MIVKAANSLIERNSEQIKKTVFSDRGDGDPLLLCSAYSDFEEGEIVANKIAELRRTEGLQYSDFAILYRTNAQSRIFEESFRKRSYPYRIFGGLSFYQRKEIKDVIAYFRLICNSNDEEAFKRIINFPARGIGDKTLQKVKDAAMERETSFWSVIADPMQPPLDVSKATFTKLQLFAAMIERFAGYAQSKNAIEVARLVLQESRMLAEFNADNSVEGKARQENVQELLNGIADFVDMRREEGNTNDKLVDFLSEVSLMSDLDNKDEDDGNHITLMTIHSAKGLEFRTVFIVGLEEDLFPNQCAQNSMRELEEERRLFYVAITRAKDHCVLSFAKSRYKYGQFNFCEPSRFIKEIDSRYITMPGGVRQATGQQQQSRAGGMFGRTNGMASTQRTAFGGQQRPFGQQQTQGGYSAASRTAPQESEPQGKRVIHESAFMQKPANLRRVSDVERDFYAPKSNHAALSVGMVVQHDRFGVGEVQSTEGVGENAKATIKFQNAGVKTLLLKFAKLKIIG